MDLVTLAIWISLGLIALGFIAIILFGIKSIVTGRFRVSSLLAMAIPVVIFAVAYALSAGATYPLIQAAVLTSLILMGLAFVIVMLTGLKSFIGF